MTVTGLLLIDRFSSSLTRCLNLRFYIDPYLPTFKISSSILLLKQSNLFRSLSSLLMTTHSYPLYFSLLSLSSFAKKKETFTFGEAWMALRLPWLSAPAHIIPRKILAMVPKNFQRNETKILRKEKERIFFNLNPFFFFSAFSS